MLTVQMLKEMEPGKLFAHGEIQDSPLGINMNGSGKQLRWVAVRGEGMPDWAIYYHHLYHSWSFIIREGDKVCGEHHVKRLVACDDESFKMYCF